jgi:GPH family glycoside/pentoside/hexuronide:cation symporter
MWFSPALSAIPDRSRVVFWEKALGYLIGPFGGLLASGIFTSNLQNYLTDVLQLPLGFLTVLQLVSTVLIVVANLLVGQVIEKTRTLAGKARPWILLSALLIAVTGILMFIVPFKSEGARMGWIAIGYNLYYSVAYPIYNTANSTLIPLSTRDSKARSELASLSNIAGLGVMGAGSMIFPMLVSFMLKKNQTLWFLVMLAISLFSTDDLSAV